MKIGFIGDLHIDYNTHHNFLNAFTRVCKDEALDVLIFCGDTNTGAFQALEFYHDLSQKVSTKILEIPGNHELYCAQKKRHLKKNPDLCFDADEYLELMLNHSRFSLFRHPIVYKDWVIIGSPSWYDYSLHRRYLSMDENTKQNFLKRNPEYKYIQGAEADPFINEKITAKSLRLMEKQLRTIRERPQGNQLKICSVIHMLPIPELYKQSHVFNTTIAFMGSKFYAELYQQYGVDMCICAHSHIRKTLTKNGTHYINVSLGHNFKWIHKTNLYAEILDTMYTMEI